MRNQEIHNMRASVEAVKSLEPRVGKVILESLYDLADLMVSSGCNSAQDAEWVRLRGEISHLESEVENQIFQDSECSGE